MTDKEKTEIIETVRNQLNEEIYRLKEAIRRINIELTSINKRLNFLLENKESE